MMTPEEGRAFVSDWRKRHYLNDGMTEAQAQAAAEVYMREYYDNPTQPQQRGQAT